MESIGIILTYVDECLDMAIINILVLVSIELNGNECTSAVVVKCGMSLKGKC